jgi:hypothetical protein
MFDLGSNVEQVHCIVMPRELSRQRPAGGKETVARRVARAIARCLRNVREKRAPRCRAILDRSFSFRVVESRRQADHLRSVEIEGEKK